MTKPPWSPAVVDALNNRQQDVSLHPYTCGSGNRKDANHLDGEGILIATEDGWKCPFCSYRQDWFRATEAAMIWRKVEKENERLKSCLSEFQIDHPENFTPEAAAELYATWTEKWRE